MNTPLRRIGLAVCLYALAKFLDLQIKPLIPSGDLGAVLYFGVAATFDWINFYMCRQFVGTKLRRDIEALCIASILANALGFTLYMAPSPPNIYPDLYVWLIKGINYVLAFRLLFMGGGNVLDHRYWRDLVRGALGRCAHLYSQKAKR